MTNSIQLPDLITEQQQLNSLCTALTSQEQIALDTEFMRTNTYAPQLGLLQIMLNEHAICIDPLADLDMQTMWQLIFDPQRTSILHSAKQDMEVMWYEQGAVVGKLIDTQICAGLLGFPAQIGYAGIADELLNVAISKSQTRTDWSRRPLTEAQLKYAAEDVAHLPRLLEIMRKRLEDTGRFEWAQEDSEAMLDLSLYKPAPDDAWQRVKSIPFLPIEQQARARALATWRERRAMDSDKPRQWILSDKALLQLAQENPGSRQALSKLSEIPDGLARNQGQKLLTVLDSANQQFARGDLELKQQVSDRDADKGTLRKLSGIVKAKASELDIAPEILASKRDIMALLRGDAVQRVTTGWRKSVIGDELIAELS